MESFTQPFQLRDSGENNHGSKYASGSNVTDVDRCTLTVRKRANVLVSGTVSSCFLRPISVHVYLQPNIQTRRCQMSGFHAEHESLLSGRDTIPSFPKYPVCSEDVHEMKEAAFVGAEALVFTWVLLGALPTFFVILTTILELRARKML